MAAYIIVGIVAYLIGSISFSVIISKKMAGFDVREKGSGNAGTTNMLRSVGKKAAVITLLCDILKDGPILRDEIMEKAAEEGITEHMLQKTKKELGIGHKWENKRQSKTYWGWEEEIENFVIPLQEEFEIP